MNTTRQITINITNVIDIDKELRKIAILNYIANKFKLKTDYKDSKTFSLKDLKFSNKQLYLLRFLDIIEITGDAQMEYNEYSFVTSKGKLYKTNDCN